jgi:hypothetical protein
MKDIESMMKKTMKIINTMVEAENLEGLKNCDPVIIDEIWNNHKHSMLINKKDKIVYILRDEENEFTEEEVYTLALNWFRMFGVKCKIKTDDKKIVQYIKNNLPAKSYVDEKDDDDEMVTVEKLHIIFDQEFFQLCNKVNDEVEFATTVIREDRYM